MTDSTNFWSDDHLKRKDEATYLTNYLAARYLSKKKEEGFVLAVNGEWGLGKSFMIERWSKELEFAGHPVVMFNSWENDFTHEPLVAFIAELNSALADQFDKLPFGEKFREKWLLQAKAVLLPSLKILGMAALKHGVGIGLHEVQTIFSDEDVDDDEDKGGATGSKLKDTGEKLSKVIEEELKSHINVKRAIANFKVRLSALVEYLDEQSGIQLPIFVFIDELDRCRPDYAITLLEGVKHLFGIPGIHFIVTTNLSELAHSVRAVYGEKFGAERYLKRFFDMEYTLPDPQGLDFAAELMMPISQLPRVNFFTGLEQDFESDRFPAKNLSLVFCTIAGAFGLSLRDQQQATKVLEATLLTMTGQIHIQFLIFLVALYQKSSQVYHRVAKEMNLSDLTGFPETVPGVGSSIFRVNDGASENGDKRSVSVKEIGNLYFSRIENASFGATSDYGFPNVLILNSRGEQQRAHLAKYIDVVRRAGQFSK